MIAKESSEKDTNTVVLQGCKIKVDGREGSKWTKAHA